MTPAHPVVPSEPLARFILTRSHINWENSDRPRLRPEAFMPHPRIELSVFRIEGLDQNGVREIGESVATQRGKTLVGRGEVTAGNIQSIGLRVEPKEPPPRHADILGWPALSGTPKEDKSRQKLIAQQIVERARLILSRPAANPEHTAG